MYDPNHIVFSSRLLYVVRTEDLSEGLAMSVAILIAKEGREP